MHDQIFRLAVQLLGGLDLPFTHEHGRRWRATATCLAWDDAPVIDGSAFDIALEVVRRDPSRQRPRLIVPTICDDGASEPLGDRSNDVIDFGREVYCAGAP